MQLANRPRATTRRISLRIATAALAVGGLAASTVVADIAGAASTHKSKRVVVSTTVNAQLGTILVSGKTLYTLNNTNCTNKCLKYWPALVLPKGVKKATPGVGVKAAKLGVVRRAHGVRQVTYGGKPLYWFVGDTSAGQVNGNVTDQWGTWSDFVTAAPGTTSPTAASGTSTAPTTAAGTTPAHTTAPASTTPHTTSPAPTTAPSPTTSPAPTTTPPTSPPATTTTAPSSGGVAF